MPKLIIQSNNVQDNPACYLCNEVTESSVPFGIFEAESKKTVCQNCAQAYGPHLVIMLRDWCKKYEQEFFGAQSMTMTIKKSRAGDSGLNQKQKTYTSGAIFSAFNIPRIANTANTANNLDLTSPQYIPVCWACGSTKNITTFPTAGGTLAVCDRCNGGLE